MLMGGRTRARAPRSWRPSAVTRSGSRWRTASSGWRTAKMTAAITTADVYQSNGVIHVIDTVVMAK